MKRLLFLLLVLPLALTLAGNSHAKNSKEECTRAAKLSEEADEMMMSSPSGAEKKLREAIDKCDSSASLHYNLAITLYRQGRNLDAEAALEEAIKINPDYAKALNALAYFHATRQAADLSRARVMAQRAVELEPQNKEFKSTLDMLVGNIDTPPRTSVKRPDAVAVIIGNKNYRSTVLPPVKYAVQDAIIMKKYLTDTLGFSEENIFLIKDAANIDFMKYFGAAGDHKGILYNRVRKDRSDIFIFYSGHGAPDTNTKKAYIVPSDADPAVIKLTGYSLDVLYENLGKLSREKNPKSVTVVLDSCFSGGSNDGMIIQDASPIFIEASTPLLQLKNAAVFTSSKGNQISSWYPEKNHGLFTYFFLKTLKESVEQGRKLSVAEMEKALGGPDSVNDFAWKLYNREQEPQVFGDKGIQLVK